jgi:putative SOS response-associated peptidase YedK
MCGRVVLSSGPLRLTIVDGLDVSDGRLGNVPRRYNAAPSQEELLVIRQKHKAGERSLALIKWGLALLPESLHRAKLGAGCIRLLE